MIIERAALVVASHPNSLELSTPDPSQRFFDRRPYKIQRSRDLANKTIGHWVWIKVDKRNPTQVIEAEDIPKQWSSRVAINGDILLDVNATLRDYRQHPELKTCAPPFPNMPWSLEVGFLDDPNHLFTREKGFFVGSMYEMTVKVSLLDAKPFIKFVIVKARQHSPRDIQLQKSQAPWVQLVRNVKRPVDQDLVAVKPDRNGMDYGVIVRKQGDNKFIWSRDSGLILINTKPFIDYSHLFVEDFVFFKRYIHLESKSILASNVQKAYKNLFRTNIVRNNNRTDALLEVRMKVPTADEASNEWFIHYDRFLGNVHVHFDRLRKCLEKVNVTMEQALGKKVRVWVGPEPLINLRIKDRCWEVKEACRNPLERDDDDIDSSDGEDDTVVALNTKFVVLSGFFLTRGSYSHFFQTTN